MWGAIAGDIIGSVYEGHNTNREDFELFTEHSTFTDDTVLTVAVMDHILGQTDLAETLRAWCRRYPNRGYGPGFLAWVGGHNMGQSRGNGAAMRVSPFAWWFKEPELILQKAEDQARLTHNSQEAIQAAKATALAVHNARLGCTKPGMVRELGPYYELSEHWPPAIRKPGGLAKESVPVALQAAIAGNSFEDTVRKAIAIGGDSDTIAAIAGAVAEAWNGGFDGGVPTDIVNEVRRRLPSEMLKIIDAFRKQIAPSCCQDVNPLKGSAIILPDAKAPIEQDGHNDPRRGETPSVASSDSQPTNTWIACSFLTLVIRAEALRDYPGGHKGFAADHQASHNGRIVVACSMGGDDYLAKVQIAAEMAGATEERDLAYFDAFGMSMARGYGRPSADRVIKMDQPWLAVRVHDGLVEARANDG